MIKELVSGIIYIIIATIVIYPVSSSIADLMPSLMPVGLVSTIVITLVRYIGFFIGLGTIKWLYKGLQFQQSDTYPQQGGFQ